MLIRHRKVNNLARDLRIRPSYAMGHLHALWHAALEQREDGDLSDWSDEFIATSSDFPGDAPQYVRLLQQHRWLDGKIIHDWVDYAGLYLTRKYSTSNKELLVLIWLKHGRVYGVNGKRTNSERIANIPNPTVPTVPTVPTNQPTDARAEDREVELPRGFPLTVDDAIAHATFVGCTVEFAMKVWNQAMSRNGHDAKGQPIRSFRHHLSAQKAYEHENRRGQDKNTPDQRERAENLKLKRL